jgi:heme exporter protein A
MLARLIIAPRQIWLLDEPLTALDEQGRQLIDQLAQDHLATGGMIVAASHERLGFAGHRLQLNRQTHDMAAV